MYWIIIINKEEVRNSALPENWIAFESANDAKSEEFVLHLCEKKSETR
jgi:hypothetical protein